MSKRAGFTLIEILLVVTIIGFLTTIGLGMSMQSVRKKNLDRAVNEIEIGIRKARDDAYNGKIYGEDCTEFSGKKITIDSSGYDIVDLCFDDADAGIESKDFGFKDLEVTPPTITMEFPYLTSGTYTDGDAVIKSGNLSGVTLEIRGGQVKRIKNDDE